jgi:hypothetical protein
MYDLLVAFCNWLQNTRWALALGRSNWAYPFVQTIHFTGLSLWLATTAAVDLQLLGARNGRQRAAELSDELFVWNWISLGIAVLGGFLLFSISAATFISKPAFRIKLGILIPLGLVLHIAVQREARAWSQATETPAGAKLAGLIELLLWLSVATAAVWSTSS